MPLMVFFIYRKDVFPLTQFISLKRISFYLVLFFNIQLTKHQIDLDIHNVYIINEQLGQYLLYPQIIYQIPDHI